MGPNSTCTAHRIRKVKDMKANRSLIAAVLFLTAGLGMIFAYCVGATSMNVGYPVAVSNVQIAITTSGPAAMGGAALTVIGLLLLIWAFLWAIIGEIGKSGWSGLRSARTFPIDLRVPLADGRLLLDACRQRRQIVLERPRVRLFGLKRCQNGGA